MPTQPTTDTHKQTSNCKQAAAEEIDKQMDRQTGRHRHARQAHDEHTTNRRRRSTRQTHDGHTMDTRQPDRLTRHTHAHTATDRTHLNRRQTAIKPRTNRLTDKQMEKPTTRHADSRQPHDEHTTITQRTGTRGTDDGHTTDTRPSDRLTRHTISNKHTTDTRQTHGGQAHDGHTTGTRRTHDCQTD